METIEDREVLRLILGFLEPKDLSRAVRVRRAWRLAGEGLWKDICLAEFPTTRAIHALPGYRKSWLQLYGEMTRTRRPLDGPKWKDFKWVVSVYLDKPQKQRLVFTDVRNMRDATGCDYDEWVTLAEPVEVTKDDKFRIDVVILRATDSKVCLTLDGKNDGEWDIEEDPEEGVVEIFLFNVAESMATPMVEFVNNNHAVRHRLQLSTSVWTGIDLSRDEWERGEMETITELCVGVGLDSLEDQETIYTDAVLPLLLR